MSRLIYKFVSLTQGVAALTHRVASRIIKTMIQTWQLTNNLVEEIHLEDMSTLDAITRQLPDGYYSTFRTFDNCERVIGLGAHLLRLYEPVGTPDVDASSLRRQLHALLEPYRPGEARVRLIMAKEGQTFIAISPLTLLPREAYEKGVRVQTVELHRNTPQLKSTAFISASDSERERIARAGIFESLLVKDGVILEGMTSNFFYVCQVANLPYVGTAAEDILLGVTREMVVEVARGRGLEVKYEPLKRDQLATAREAFITSSSRGVVPVIQIDDVVIGEGTPGPITKDLIAAYNAEIINKAESILPSG